MIDTTPRPQGQEQCQLSDTCPFRSTFEISFELWGNTITTYACAIHKNRLVEDLAAARLPHAERFLGDNMPDGPLAPTPPPADP